MSEWVHNNFWKYHALTKIPLVLIALGIGLDIIKLQGGG